jgi:hypothetical protein
MEKRRRGEAGKRGSGEAGKRGSGDGMIYSYFYYTFDEEI